MKYERGKLLPATRRQQIEVEVCGSQTSANMQLFQHFFLLCLVLFFFQCICSCFGIIFVFFKMISSSLPFFPHCIGQLFVSCFVLVRFVA